MTVYLDNNASTRPAPEVVAAMLPFLRDSYGNASSVHREGRAAREAMDRAREQVSALVGCDAREVCFTASGSEANALAVKGAALAAPNGRRHLVLSAIEHPSVLGATRQLESAGFRVSLVLPGSDGVIDADTFAEALTSETLLASIMAANNETGALQPIDSVARRCREAGVLLHVDAVQAAGKVPLGCRDLPCDLLSLSGHKLHGPKGAGALFIRRGLELAPLVAGHQERGRRGGSEDVAAVVGLGRACELARRRLSETDRVRVLRDRLEGGLLRRIPGSARNGPLDGRIANTTNLRFPGCEGETALIALDLLGICASSGAACSSGSQSPSHVLLAMGLSAAEAQSSLRFSLSSETTADEIDRVIEVLPDIVERSRRSGSVSSPKVTSSRG
jgi:cysteine desulfurase